MEVALTGRRHEKTLGIVTGILDNSSVAALRQTQIKPSLVSCKRTKPSFLPELTSRAWHYRKKVFMWERQHFKSVAQLKIMGRTAPNTVRMLKVERRRRQARRTLNPDLPASVLLTRDSVRKWIEKTLSLFPSHFSTCPVVMSEFACLCMQDQCDAENGYKVNR